LASIFAEYAGKREKGGGGHPPPICDIFSLLVMPSAVALTTNGDVSMSQVLSETQTDREEDGQERKPKDQKSDSHTTADRIIQHTHTERLD